MSIKEVAKRAKVSQGTVSRVLNNTGYFSEETKKKVLLAAQELNYIPNRLAQNLSKGKSGLIAIMYPFEGSEALYQLIQGVSESAKSKGESLVFFETNYDIYSEKKVLNLLNENTFDALIIIDCELPIHYVEKFNKKNNIIFCQYSKSSSVSSVFTNFKKLSQDMASYLEGYKDTLGVIVGKQGLNNYIEKNMIQVYEEVTSDSNLSNVVTNSSGFEKAYKVGEFFLKKKNPPRVIWTDSNNSGAGVKKAYIDQGINNVIIFSINYLPIGIYSDLLMVDCNPFEKGQQAYRLIGSKVTHVEIDYTFKFDFKNLKHTDN